VDWRLWQRQAPFDGEVSGFASIADAATRTARSIAISTEKVSNELLYRAVRLTNGTLAMPNHKIRNGILLASVASRRG